MQTPVFLLAIVGGVVACGGAEPTAANAPPVPGRYVLETFNGQPLPAHVSATATVDTGEATLWSSGYYEMHYIGHANGNPYNGDIENGHWTVGSSAFQFAASHFNGAVLPESGTLLAGGRFTVDESGGSSGTLGFRRIGGEPPPPVRPFDPTGQPAYTAALTTSGTGSAMIIATTLTVANKDVIDRTLTFPTPCTSNLWLTTDSTHFTSVAWTDYYDDPRCVPLPFTDTVPKGGQKAYQQTRSVSELKLFNGGPPAAGRYYVWLVSDLKISSEPGLRLGWVTISY